MKCKFDNTEMVKGKALSNSVVSSRDSFDSKSGGQTCHYVATGALEEVLKCPECGYSVSIEKQK